jgi:hypothetical protein
VKKTILALGVPIVATSTRTAGLPTTCSVKCFNALDIGPANSKTIIAQCYITTLQSGRQARFYMNMNEHPLTVANADPSVNTVRPYS